MGFLDDYRARRVTLTSRESVQTLTAMERLFQGGKNWTQGAYHRLNGQKCLVGAAQSVNVVPIEDARYWLKQAIAERGGGTTIEEFNDTRASYREIAEVLARAKQLAAAHALQVSAPVAQILPPPPRPALPPPAPVMPVIIDLTPEPAPARKAPR